MTQRGVSVLFAAERSIYWSLGSDVWDVKRDATKFRGAGPVVAHPPCRTWVHCGRDTYSSAPEEHAYAIFALGVVRKNGGVLEHPARSQLWFDQKLPAPAAPPDAWGGFTLYVQQGWWGHPTPKPTWLYVCGIQREEVVLPTSRPVPRGRSVDMNSSSREKTCRPFAEWLVDLAARCKPTLEKPDDNRAATHRVWSRSNASKALPPVPVASDAKVRDQHRKANRRVLGASRA